MQPKARGGSGLSKVVGVLGGMGPEATADFFVKLIRRTPATEDAGHLRVIIDSNPQIPDRTAAVEGHGTSPVPQLVATAKNLVRAGADLLVVPCITAHAFLDDVRTDVDVPVLDAMTLTARHVGDDFAPEDELAILASTGTLKTALFQKAMPDRTFILPTDEEQERIVMDAIYGPAGVKTVGVDAGTLERMQDYVAELADRGAAGVIAGCTEFSVLFADTGLPVPLVDPMWLLAKEAVRLALKT